MPVSKASALFPRARRRATAFVFVLLLALLPALPAAGQYPATSGELTVNEDSRCSWTLSGSGFAPGATITIELSRTGVVATFTADATGSFTYTLTISRFYARGRQTLSASGQNTIGGLHTLSKSVVVRGGCRGAGVGLIDRLPDPPAPLPTGQFAAAVATALVLVAVALGGRIDLGRPSA